MSVVVHCIHRYCTRRPHCGDVGSSAHRLTSFSVSFGRYFANKRTAFHRECGVKMVRKTMTSKRRRSGGKKKEIIYFCGDKCWLLESSSSPSVMSTTTTRCLPPPGRLSSEPSLHPMASAIKGARKEQGSMMSTELGGGDEAKQPFLTSPDKVSPPKLSLASLPACTPEQGTPKDTVSERNLLHGPDFGGLQMHSSMYGACWVPWHFFVLC